MDFCLIVFVYGRMDFMVFIVDDDLVFVEVWNVGGIDEFVLGNMDYIGGFE